jgi:hypothetical protein
LLQLLVRLPLLLLLSLLFCCHPSPKAEDLLLFCFAFVVALAFLAVFFARDLLLSSAPVQLRLTARQTKMRRSISTLLLLLITIPMGLAVRLLPLHLPWFLYKYLGSALWAIALYWFLATLLPKLRPLAVAALAITIATLLELSRLIPIAPIDAFRLTLAGQILLGRYFSLKNIVAYILAIAITATLDRFFLLGSQQNAGNLTK